MVGRVACGQEGECVGGRMGRWAGVAVKVRGKVGRQVGGREGKGGCDDV